MNKKKILFIVILIIIILVSYTSIGTLIIKNKMNNYLQVNGYSTNEIKSIEVKHSFLNILLSYNEWNIAVKYNDEPESIYFYTYKNKEIITNGISGSKDKDNLKHADDYK